MPQFLICHLRATPQKRGSPQFYPVHFQRERDGHKMHLQFVRLTLNNDVSTICS
jgi:hypothetical protein